MRAVSHPVFDLDPDPAISAYSAVSAIMTVVINSRSPPFLPPAAKEPEIQWHSAI